MRRRAKREGLNTSCSTTAQKPPLIGQAESKDQYVGCIIKVKSLPNAGIVRVTAYTSAGQNLSIDAGQFAHSSALKLGMLVYRREDDGLYHTRTGE
jgi:hypothetical protein